MGKYPEHKISEIEKLPHREVRKRLLKKEQEKGLDVWGGLFCCTKVVFSEEGDSYIISKFI